MSTPTMSLDAIRAERDGILSQVRGIAAKAESEGRGFTGPEQETVTDLLAKAEASNSQMERLKSVAATTQKITELMGRGGDTTTTDGKGARAQGRFAKAIQGALFGVPVDASGMSTDRRAFFDSNGDNLPAPKAANPFNVRNGMASIPIGRRNDGGEVVLLPEFGGTLLGLLNKPDLTSGDAYRFRRQTERTEDAAQFVPKGAKKPEAAFGYEVIDDRVRTLAVLSEPIAIQDLQDVPLLREDVANELANRIIWRLENAIVNGNQTDVDDAGREMFDGILNVTGVREQPYLVSPFRTIRRSLTVLEAAGYDPDDLTVGLNPVTWEALETETDADGRPLFSGLYTARQEPILFGRPVRLSNQIAEDDTIVADWRHGMVTMRTDIELAWSDGGEEFARNQVRFRADLRAGFNLSQPGAFVHARLAGQQ